MVLLPPNTKKNKLVMKILLYFLQKCYSDRFLLRYFPSTLFSSRSCYWQAGPGTVSNLAV